MARGVRKLTRQIQHFLQNSLCLLSSLPVFEFPKAFLGFNSRLHFTIRCIFYPSIFSTDTKGGNLNKGLVVAEELQMDVDTCSLNVG